MSDDPMISIVQHEADEDCYPIPILKVPNSFLGGTDVAEHHRTFIDRIMDAYEQWASEEYPDRVSRAEKFEQGIGRFLMRHRTDEPS